MLYYIFKPFVRLFSRVYFRKIHVEGIENIPRDHPFILAPNHQNAFLDAVIIAVWIDQPLHFLVRADVFKHPLIAWFLSLFHLIPVYRMRDGYGSLEKNKAIFNQCTRLFIEGKSILLFPEGDQHDSYRIRPLKKGCARIALQSLCNPKSPPHLSIVPVGIYYQSYTLPRTKIHIQIGTPIRVDEYSDLYINHPSQAINQLTKKLQVELLKVNLNLPEENYSAWLSFLRLKNKPKLKDWGVGGLYGKNFIHNKDILQKFMLDPVNQAKAKRTYSNATLKKQFPELSKKHEMNLFLSVLLYFIASPLILISILFFLIPVTFIFGLKLIVKDRMFDGSLHFLFSAIVLGTWAMSISVFVACSFGSFYLGVFAFLVQWIFLLFTLDFLQYFRSKI